MATNKNARLRYEALDKCFSNFSRKFYIEDLQEEVCKYLSREFIERSVAESKAKHIIVATHHVPSFELMADEFKGSPINGAFTVELGNYIANSLIEYWIYGHSHRNINKQIGNTKCICNQLGYTFHNEHKDFNPSAIIEI